jgi:E3 ubiquitin-protein ligase RNF146
MSTDDSCGVCLDKLQTPISLPCTHKFCYLCVKGTLSFGNNKCPLCRCIIPDDYFERAMANKDDAIFENTKNRWMYSGRTRGWWFFQDNHNDEIECAWQKFLSSSDEEDDIAKIYIASIEYEINFVSMTQVSLTTSATRRIKRVEDAVLDNARGIAGVKYVTSENLPKYDVKYTNPSENEFNPYYSESYVTNSDEESGSESGEIDYPESDETEGDISEEQMELLFGEHQNPNESS